MIIAERGFVLDCSQERTEQLVMKAMISALQPERLDASDERSFVAMVRANIGPIGLRMAMAGEIVSPLNPLEFLIKLRGYGGMIWLNQKAIFALTPANEGKTEVACKVVAEGMGVLLRIFLLWRVKSFAKDVLDRFESHLRQWG